MYVGCLCHVYVIYVRFVYYNVYICVYVCMCVCLHVLINICVCLCRYARSYIRMLLLLLLLLLFKIQKCHAYITKQTKICRHKSLKSILIPISTL